MLDVILLYLLVSLIYQNILVIPYLQAGQAC